MLHPLGKSAAIDYIKVLDGKKDQAVSGESIGLVLKDKSAMQGIKRGEIVCDTSSAPNITSTITETVFWMNGEPLLKTERLQLKCATQQVECKVKKIRNRLNSSSLEVIEEDAQELRETEVATITLKTTGYLCMDPFEKVAEMGRFVLMRDTDTVAGGVVH